MSVLTCSSKLTALRTLLTHSFPQSLKVCGGLQHVLTGNAFRLEVLVDQWPDFSTVICRPSLQVGLNNGTDMGDGGKSFVSKT
ncbi:hypothetical protein AB205_0160690, partial [Aquarana catesbeiana]